MVNIKLKAKRRKKEDKVNTSNDQYIVDSEGKKTAVILPVDQYEQLLEDLHDLSVIAERRNEKPISLEEIKRRLKKNGLL